MMRRGAGAVLQIHLPDRIVRDELLVRWALRGDGPPRAGVARLAELPRADEVILVLPVSRVGFVRAQLPEGSAERLAKIAPFAVEEAVATAPEDLHAVVLDEMRDRARLVAVVDRAWLASVVSALESAGVPPDRATVESALVDARHDGWTVAWSGDGGFVSFGGIEAVTVDATADGDVPLALQLAADEARARDGLPRSVRVLVANGVEAPDVARWSASLGVPVAIAGEWRPEALDAAACPDLLHGGPTARWIDGDWLARLRPAAIVLGVIIVAHVLLTAGDWARLAFEAHALRGQMEAQFRRAFPEATAVVDPALQMRRNLAELRRGAGEADAADLVPLLAKLSPALAAFSASPQSLRFERGEVELQLPVSLDETRERVASRLRVPGLRVSVERITSGGGAAFATVRVAPGG